MPANFSNLTSASITDVQLNSLIKQMNAAGYKPEQFFEVAVARGMNAGEAKTVQDRINKLASSSLTNNLNNSATSNETDTGAIRKLNSDTSKTEPKQRKLSSLESQLYGADIFNNSNLTFEPNLRIATPRNYIIGPDDEIV
ncbi:MAG: hypothetical protein M3R72_07945, partial [Bacteroidota bacterium]|nr:hypothetical protein [Bacteroidota bacterium]